MYIIIVGAGEVGTYLARILIEEQHSVALIEENPELARELDRSLDALVVQGSGVSQQSLKLAGIDHADLLLAVTHTDEINLIACMAASKYGKDVRTVARVRDADYLTGKGHLTGSDLGVTHIVGPERAVANEIQSLLSYQGAGEIHELAEGRIVLLEMDMSHDSPLVHESIAELRDVLPSPSLIVGIDGPKGFRIPNGKDQLRPDERAYILTPPEILDEWWILSGRPWHQVQHVLLIGCGTIGLHVARELEAKKMYPTILEYSLERAEEVSQYLTKSIVLHADGADPAVLQEQLDERSDAVVVLFDDDEKAVLIGLFAKSLGAKKVIVRSDARAYAPLAHKLGVDSLISPSRAIADEILQLVRGRRVAKSLMLGDHQGEVLEVRVSAAPSNRKIVETPLRDLQLPDGALIGAIVRGDGISIADGSTVLEPGDTLLVVAVPSSIHKLTALFE